MNQDTQDFLSTLLTIASDHDDQRYLMDHTIYDFSEQFTDAVDEFLSTVRERMEERMTAIMSEGFDIDDDTDNSFGSNVFFSLTGHGTGFFDTAVVGGAIQYLLYKVTDDRRYRFDELEHMLDYDEDTETIDLIYIPEHINDERKKLFSLSPNTQ